MAHHFLLDTILAYHSEKLQLVIEVAFTSFCNMKKSDAEATKILEEVRSLKLLYTRNEELGSAICLRMDRNCGEWSSISDEWKCAITDDFFLRTSDFEEENPQRDLTQEAAYHVMGVLADWINYYFLKLDFDGFYSFTSKLLKGKFKVKYFEDYFTVNLGGVEGFKPECEIIFAQNDGIMSAYAQRIDYSVPGALKPATQMEAARLYLDGTVNIFKSDDHSFYEIFPKYYETLTMLAEYLLIEYAKYLAGHK